MFESHRYGVTTALVLVLFLIRFVGSSPVSSDDFTSTYALQILRYAKSADIHNLMNESVDPCENFYEFACGYWNRINPANSNEGMSTGFFETLEKALNRKISNVLAVEDETDTEIDKKVKNFYESCLNVGALKSVYTDKLLEIFQEFGKMPALEGDNWTEQEFDWLKTVAEISYKYGISIIIGYDIMSDFVNVSLNRLYIGQPDFPLESKSIYLDEGNAVYRLSYQQYIASALEKYLGLKSNLAQQTAEEILDFEIALAQGMVDDKSDLQLNETSIPTTLDEMQEKYSPDLNVKQLINISLGLMPTGKVYEQIEEYQENLVELLRATPKRTVANYIFYTLLDNFIVGIPKDKAELRSNCRDITKKYFGKNLDNMIYRKYNTSSDTEKGVEFMWHEIQTTFENILLSERLKWINNATRQYAVEKLYAMKMEINSMENENENGNFLLETGQLKVKKHDLVENLKAVMQLQVQNFRKRLYEPPSSFNDESYSAVYIFVENKIIVPLSMLQPYYVWSSSYPKAVTYGTLGFLISHELMHGFDDTGRNFDKKGNHCNWWDEKSTSDFVNRTKCFREQYKNYIYNDQPLPEMASQSENIADNGGVRLAYEAYLHWHENALRSKEEMQLEILPRLKYSTKQLFFISLAQVWCSDTLPAYRNFQTSTDKHAPGIFRVIGPLSNFPEFSEVFHCPIGSNMNPLKKCSIY